MSLLGFSCAHYVLICLVFVWFDSSLFWHLQKRLNSCIQIMNVIKTYHFWVSSAGPSCGSSILMKNKVQAKGNDGEVVATAADTSSNQAECVDIHILEKLDSSEYAISTWPCALLLSAYIVAHSEEFTNKHILELGAGTALPSLVACHPIVGARHVWASERADEPDLLATIRQNILLNDRFAGEKCNCVPLDWSLRNAYQQFLQWQRFENASENNGGIDESIGKFPQENEARLPIDVVLGADVLYSDEDVFPICRFLHQVFDDHQNAYALIAYHERK